jgi:hypothetical protein
VKVAKILVAVAIALGFLWYLSSHREQIHSAVKDRDSLAYWAAGNLLLHGKNPYSPAEVFALQQSQGYSEAKPLVLRTPPWSLWLILPLGVLNSYWAWVFWLLVLLASLLVSMRVCWQLYGDGPRPPTIFLLAGYLFAPVAGCLIAGQLGLVLLLGFVAFIALEKRHPYLAGAALLIPFAKPHVLALLWPMLAVWVIVRKKWTVAAGFFSVLIVACFIALIFDPAVFAHYQEMLRQSSIQKEFIPALSGVVRLVFFRRFFWTQFIPVALGFVWSAWYYSKRRQTWDWASDGPALLVVSVLVTPYAWMTDEAILLPAILQGVMWVYSERSRLKWPSQLAVLLFGSLDLLLLLILRAKIPFATGIYFWSSLLWACWYWYARRFRKQPVPKALSQVV